jgi:fructan beta-fructosidase
VYSHDRGRSWAEFEGNPVVKHEGRDPRLLWHAPSARWVMAVYDESDGKRWIAFYTSPDLKSWTFRSRVEGFFECPDLFELPIDGDATRRRWVLTAASTEYMVGRFDGTTFRPETPKLPGHRGRGFYAAQTFSHEPRGRVVQLGWLQTTTPDMPFNQGMSLPMELGLRTTPDGPRLTWRPVEELTRLRSRTILPIRPGDDPLAGIRGELIEVRAVFEPAAGSIVTLKVRGVDIALDAAKQTIRVGDQVAPAPAGGGKQRITIYADRTSVEVFAGDGLTYVPLPINLDPRDTVLKADIAGRPIPFGSLEVFELGWIWPASEGPPTRPGR